MQACQGIRAVLDGSLPRFNLEYPCHSPEQRRWFSMSVTPLGTQGGGVVVAHTNITERKSSEDQLRKLTLALHQSSESIVITDLDTRIEYVNEAFTLSSGYSLEEVIGKNPRILQSGKTRQETYVGLWLALTQGHSWKGEFINRRKDGSEYVEFAIISPLRQPDGSISHYVAVKEDITEKKRLGSELDRHRHHLEELVVSRTAELTLARQQADAANQAKSAFLANMSHDMPRLATRLATGDRDTARRLAHTLKGTAGTLGADRVADIARELEQRLSVKPLKDLRDNDIRTHMENINREMMALAAALPTPSAMAPAADSKLQDPIALKAVLNELDTLLAHSDTAAVALCQQHAASLRTVLGTPFNDLARQLSQFEFEAARATLRTLRG